jgi:hypothetical protein
MIFSYQQKQFLQAIKLNDLNKIKYLMIFEEILDEIFLSEALFNAINQDSTNIVKYLLNDIGVNPSNKGEYNLLAACNNLSNDNYDNNNTMEIITLLLSYSRVDPSASNNLAISQANLNELEYVVSLLWKDIRVKNTLSENNNNLYNRLLKIDIQNKIVKF